MRLTARIFTRCLFVAAAVAGLAGTVAAAGTPASAARASSTPAAGGVGYLRLAHLSPNTPAVDVYLYSFGHAKAMIVLKHVSYGTVSPYQTVRSGEYTVAMRGAGAAPSAKPVLSTSVEIAPGGAYTVAGMGPKSGLRLQIIQDRLHAPRGGALVRIIQASLRQHKVSVSADGKAISRGQPFASVSSYRDLRPGDWTLSATGPSEHASTTVDIRPAGIYTLVVLDDPGHLVLTTLEDAAGSRQAPAGAAATGFGGTAPRPGPARLPWLIITAGGLALAGCGTVRLQRAPVRGR
ncbi:MAG TPA: DUF4397 domain-containing protein [Streptosporangiaceae bacterium]|jgi:hypothetical protein